MPTAPKVNSGRYWKLFELSSLTTNGFGPFWWGPLPSPLPVSQTSVFPFGVTRTSVGYAAVGTRPTREPSAVSKTASSSAEDSATYSLEPSGERASAVGLVPTPRERAVDQLP